MWATHTLFLLPGSNCVSLVASPPLLKYLPTPLVGNPIIKILDTPLPLVLNQTLRSQLSISSGGTKASSKSHECYLHFSKLAITSQMRMKCIASISVATSMDQKPGAVDIQLADKKYK